MSPVTRQSGQLRIIAGEWRGRRLSFAPVAGLRPTPDRVRETLFNWLQPWIAGARCLDLFAGSGALGWEAASRGAARVVMVDADKRAVASLKQMREVLDTTRVEVVRADAARFLRRAAEPFDVIFLDPPYASGMQASILAELHDSGWLAPDSRVYVEFDASRGLPALPEGWQCAREGRAGTAGFALLTVVPASEAVP